MKTLKFCHFVEPPGCLSVYKVYTEEQPGHLLGRSSEVIAYRAENNSRAGHGDGDIKHTLLKLFSRLNSLTKIPIIYAFEKSVMSLCGP